MPALRVNSWPRSSPVSTLMLTTRASLKTATQRLGRVSSASLLLNRARPPIPPALYASQAERLSHHRHLERCGIDHCSRGRWRHLHACRARNQHRFHQSLHSADRMPLHVALHLGQVKEKVSQAVARRYIGELLALPGRFETILASADQCEQLAERYHRVEDFMFLGRAHSLSDRHGRRAQTEGDLVYSRGKDIPPAKPNMDRMR